MPDAAPSRSAPSLRGFWSLILTQAQGAFSDNALKNLVIFIIIGLGLSQQERDKLVPLVGALFAVPFVLFSMAGGFLADRFSKRSVTIGTKVLEIAVVLVALAGLAAQNLSVCLIAIFLFSTQGALFGPAKYGLLPELVPQPRLSWANGIIELGTFLSIIGGTVAGGWMAEAFRGRQAWSGGILLVLAALGLFTSMGVGRVPAADPARKFQWNFLGDLWQQVQYIRGDRTLFLAVAGNTYFWFLGALLQSAILIYGSDVLHLSETRGGFLMAALGVGIGLGSFAAGYLSGNKIEYGLIPLGALGMTSFGAALARAELTFASVLSLLALLGFFAGFAVVPLNALIQHRPDESRKGGVIAASNLLSFVGIFIASGVYYLLAVPLKVTPHGIFAVGAALTLASTAYAIWILPDALVRFLLWLLTHTLYRIRVVGRDNIPEKGGGLFVCNHLSFVDALLLSAATDRPIRFLMFKDIYEHPAVYPLAKLMRSIPVSAKQRPREMIRSLREASDAIQAGEMVCIFAEGQITRVGQLLPFRRGLERIMKGVEAPIVPVALDGVWGSIFSFERGRFLWKFPRRIPYPVTVSFGAPLPATATAFDVRAVVQQLQSDAWEHRKSQMPLLHRSFVHSARRHPFRFAMADGRDTRVTFAVALTRAIFLARRLRATWQGQRMVGLLLPPSVPGALVNFAALLCGKVPVNLNYTAADEALASCAQQCKIETVVTVRAFLEKLKLTVPGRAVYLEDLAANPTLGEKLVAMAMAWLLPVRMLERALGLTRKPSPDDLATIIFSSGSTGDPKGVMLSHYNVAANVEQLGQTFLLGRKDRILGILPFFHSFGFTGTLFLPAALGIGVVYHPNPLDSRAIGALVSSYSVTFLLATPTFLQAYMRRCPPEDFGSLQFVLAGAEKLPERVGLAFEDTFGIRPMEGYGCTECSPAVAVNTRDFRSAGFRQVGGKRGKIGHPLPGVSVRVVDIETGSPQAAGQPGLLEVRGPNVMVGYLGRPEKTAEVLRNGWYTTGDVALIDEDGFLQITDRLSRFSKIAGEMVPHVKIEEKLHELAEKTEQCFAVTGVPDARKGERLIVLHTLPPEKLQPCLEKLPQSGLPNLWIPRASQFLCVEAIPYLGTGKLDLRRIRDIAMSLAKEAPEG